MPDGILTTGLLEDLGLVATGSAPAPMAGTLSRTLGALTSQGALFTSPGGALTRSTAMQRVLQALPAYFDRDPAAELALDITPDAIQATLQIAQRVLTIRTTGGTAPSLTIPLQDYSLAALRTYLNGVPGYTATLRTEDSTRSALCLIEIPAPRDLLADSRVYAFTALLWAVLSPLAWALEDLQEQIRQGLAQMTLKTATGPWVDLWGAQYYGGVYRLFNEQDRPYADRIIREVLRWRLNARAMEQIAWEELGVDIRVSNLHDQAWVVGVTNFGFLVGRKYARTTIEVVVDGVSSDLWLYIERNRAAGVLPFIRFSEQYESLLPMVIAPSGATAISGRSEAMIPIAMGQATEFLLPFTSGVIGAGAGALFMLGGASVLAGGHTLGDPPPGMNITDVWSTPA